jgi:hypothetical protein
LLVDGRGSHGGIEEIEDELAALGIPEETYLQVFADGDEVRFRRLDPARPLSGDDPIWALVGAGRSGASDVSEEHDRHLAEGEQRRGWWSDCDSRRESPDQR